MKMQAELSTLLSLMDIYAEDLPQLSVLETSIDEAQLIEAATSLANAFIGIKDGKDWWDGLRPRLLRIVSRMHSCGLHIVEMKVCHAVVRLHAHLWFFDPADIHPILACVTAHLELGTTELEEAALEVISELLDPENGSETEQNDREDGLVTSMRRDIPGLAAFLDAKMKMKLDANAEGAMRVQAFVAQVAVQWNMASEEEAEAEALAADTLRAIIDAMALPPNSASRETALIGMCRAVALMARSGHGPWSARLVELNAVALLVSLMEQCDGGNALYSQEWTETETCPHPMLDAALIALIHLIADADADADALVDEAVLTKIIAAWGGHKFHGRQAMGRFDQFEWVERSLKDISEKDKRWNECGGGNVSWLCC